ncbi:hypothetical protein AVEN_150590-1 [Araneus ventricosus]|uniref:Uncharacterized protein n=1 Tax=Araneus ventricosus TaxID=182803 RepID=A0A4Y2MC52_ARAVE|nr:hypothetical protein AVEN_150590-1 [Araneus ventricosus]
MTSFLWFVYCARCEREYTGVSNKGLPHFKIRSNSAASRCVGAGGMLGLRSVEDSVGEQSSTGKGREIVSITENDVFSGSGSTLLEGHLGEGGPEYAWVVAVVSGVPLSLVFSMVVVKTAVVKNQREVRVFISSGAFSVLI